VKRKIEDGELKVLHKEGKTDKEIAELKGMCQAVLAGRRRKLGLKPNDPKEIIPTVSKEKLGYMAGILDGEGSIMISKSKYRVVGNPLYQDCKNPEYSVRVTMKNTNRTVVEMLWKSFGGFIHTEKKIYLSPNGFRPRKLLSVFDISNRKAYTMLKILLPYLIIKPKQAEEAIKLYELKREAFKIKGKKAYPPELIAKLERIYMGVKKLNA